jgi:NAD(P)H-dependent FMN reductase
LLNILAISGSLRAVSTNSALIEALAGLALPACHVAIYDGLGRLPIFNPDNEGARTPVEAASLIEAVTRSDGVIVACPEYAHGVPGGLKNALDWLVSRDAAVGKPAMLVHASSRSLACRAALTEIMRTMSFSLHPGRDLEIALLGKNTEQVKAMLMEPANTALMRERLEAFCAFVNGR